MNPQSNTIDVRERVRKSFDKIRVNNPFEKPYSVVWDGFHHVVPAESYAILERYLAEKWLEEQCKRIITEEADQAIKTENKRRVDNGMAVMDKTRKTGEQYEFETPFYANWNARFPEIIKKYGLYGGVVQEYGMDFVPQAPTNDNQIVGSLIDQLEKASTMTVPTASVETHPLETKPNLPPERSLIDELTKKDVFTLRKIAKEKGIVTDKTTTKEDLIKQITA